MAQRSAVEGIVVVEVRYHDGSHIEYDIPEGDGIELALHALDRYAYTRRLYDKNGNEMDAL